MLSPTLSACWRKPRCSLASNTSTGADTTTGGGSVSTTASSAGGELRRSMLLLHRPELRERRGSRSLSPPETLRSPVLTQMQLRCPLMVRTTGARSSSPPGHCHHAQNLAGSSAMVSTTGVRSCSPGTPLHVGSRAVRAPLRLTTLPVRLSSSVCLPAKADGTVAVPLQLRASTSQVALLASSPREVSPNAALPAGSKAVAAPPLASETSTGVAAIRRSLPALHIWHGLTSRSVGEMAPAGMLGVARAGGSVRVPMSAQQPPPVMPMHGQQISHQSPRLQTGSLCIPAQSQTGPAPRSAHHSPDAKDPSGHARIRRRLNENARLVASNADRAADFTGVAVARLATRLARKSAAQSRAEGHSEVEAHSIAELATSLAGVPQLQGGLHHIPAELQGTGCL